MIRYHDFANLSTELMPGLLFNPLSFLDALETVTDIDWGGYEDAPAKSRGKPSPLVGAEAVTSRTKRNPDRHAILVDLDHPAMLVASSTPGHLHLYIPGEWPWDHVMELFDVLVKLRLVEPGFRDASKARGASYLRLPWVAKDDEHYTAQQAVSDYLNHPTPEERQEAEAKRQHDNRVLEEFLADDGPTP